MEAVALIFRRLKKLLQRRGHSREDAEDLIQEAFLRMQTYCERGGNVREPEAFLARTVQRLAINAHRDRRAGPFSPEKAEDLACVIDPQPLPDEVFSADECLAAMRTALDATSRRTREILFMHRLDGMSYEQIAREMQLSISAIEKHIARAMAALARENNQDWK